jgi:hypothetical protein
MIYFPQNDRIISVSWIQENVWKFALYVIIDTDITPCAPNEKWYEEILIEVNARSFSFILQV